MSTGGIVLRTALTVLILSVPWTADAAAVSCPPGTQLVARSLPQGRQERCVLVGRSGKRHGPFRTWYANGSLRHEGSYRYGRPQGLWTYYHPNGQKRMEGNWRFGKAQGHWSYWYENGTRESAGRFHDGKREGRWAYWDAYGELRFEVDWTDGKLQLEAVQVSARAPGPR